MIWQIFFSLLFVIGYFWIVFVVQQEEFVILRNILFFILLILPVIIGLGVIWK